VTEESGSLVGARVARITAERPLGDPELAQAVLADLLRVFAADGGRIYALDLSTGHYVSTVRDSRSVGDTFLDARNLRVRSDWGPLESAIAFAQPQVSNVPTEWRGPHGVREYGSRAVFPILRQHTPVGLVDLHANHPGAFVDWRAQRLAEAATAMRQLASSYEARTVQRILERTAAFRVTLFGTEQEEVRNLMRFVGESSGMQYSILRRYDETTRSLTCIGTNGFRPGLDPDKLSLLDLKQRFPPFHRVVESRTHHAASDLRGAQYAAIREHPELRDVRSFVAAPVLIGRSFWGVLSFAAAVEYEYSDLEIFALRALANLAGVAFGAARSADDAAASRYDDGQMMQAALSNEVVAATRHEMADQLEIVSNARTALEEVVRPLTQPKRGTRLTHKDVDFLLFQADSLDTAHSEMIKIMDTIRLSQRDLLPEDSRVSVREAWRRAVEPFTYRIKRARVARVDDSAVPTNLDIVGSFDWLRIVFMQLLLNSLDAFDRNFQKATREIVLREAQGTSERLVLRYIDNAGGIIPGTLMRRQDAMDGAIPDLVFERYVSSKEKGTGLGLASCRAALATMEGSIDLIDWHRGVTFELDLRRWPDE
jgi:signal transduction histidine kinase